MLYVTGDTHGDYERFTSSKIKKLKKGELCGCHKPATDPRWDKLKKLLEDEESGDEK